MKVLVATNNKGKVERYRQLLAGTDIELFTPAELGIESVEVEENGETLAENAELKARAYLGKTELPILANDTGIWVEGEGMINTPRRTALAGLDEEKLTQEEIAEIMMEFWKSIARKYGGEVAAAWPETFAVAMSDGSVRFAESRREIILTDQQHGPVNLHMPLRPLYRSKMTGKPVLEQTPEEEAAELAPVRDALISLLLP